MIPQSKLVLFLSSSLLLSSFSFAAEKSPKPRDERFDDQLEFAKPSLSSANPQVSDKRIVETSRFDCAWIDHCGVAK